MSTFSSLFVATAALALFASGCGDDSIDRAPRLINANVVDIPFSDADGGRVLLVEIELDAAPTCEGSATLPLYGIVIDLDPEDEPAQPEDPIFIGLDLDQRITANCIDGELGSTAGSVKLTTDEETGHVLVTISADGSSLPSTLGWVAFVADEELIQRSPAAPDTMVWRSLVHD